MILYNASDDDNLFTDNSLGADGARRQLTEGLKVKAYIADAAVGPEGRRSAPAGTYQVAQRAVDDDLLVARPRPGGRADIIKPDITAPGVQILAGNTPFPDRGAGHG